MWAALIMMNVIETPRLALRQLTVEDDAFIYELVNDPAWLRFIGDRGVRTVADARAYILKGPVASYAQHGFGLWLTLRKAGGVPIGMCGLIKRETMEDVDVGFAILPEFREQGYAFESASASLNYGRDVLKLKRIVAVCSPDNAGSIRVLEKLGLRYEKMIRMTPDAAEIKLFAVNF